MSILFIYGKARKATICAIVVRKGGMSVNGDGERIRMTELEKLTLAIQRAGDEWLESRLVSDQLDADEKNYLAALMSGIEKEQFDGQKVSDAKLERIARAMPEFREYVRSRVAAQIKTLKLKNRYDNLGSLWESKRSDQSLEKEKIAKGLFDSGRG